MKYLIHILIIILFSSLSTIIPFPVSLTDGYLVTSFLEINVILTILIMVVADSFAAIIGYKLSYLLSKKLVKKDKTKEKLEKLKIKINKFGFIYIVVAAATPVPWTLSLYAAGAIQWGNNEKIFWGTFIGKLIRYIVIAVLTYYGIQIIN